MAPLSYSAQRLLSVFYEVVPHLVEDAFLVVDATLFDMKDTFGGPLDAKIAPDAVLLLLEALFSLSLTRMPPWTFLQKLTAVVQNGNMMEQLSVPPPLERLSRREESMDAVSTGAGGRVQRSPSPTNPQVAEPTFVTVPTTSTSLTATAVSAMMEPQQQKPLQDGGSCGGGVFLTATSASPTSSQFLFPHRTEFQTQAAWKDQCFVTAALFDVATSVAFEDVATTVTKHYGRKVVEELSAKLMPHVKDGTIPLLRATLVVRSVAKSVAEDWDGWMTATVPPSRAISSDDLESSALSMPAPPSLTRVDESKTCEEIPAVCVTSLRSFCQLLVRNGK